MRERILKGEAAAAAKRKAEIEAKAKAQAAAEAKAKARDDEHRKIMRQNRERVRTIPQRPGKDEGEDAAIKYGTACYFIPEADQAARAEIDDLEMLAKAKSKLSLRM
mmetsp:Transcript_37259/g.111299  ORF Transcript_37259/g.111299 Transcript_37259/m.111299 type:complete len:107 (+) Transcript_37259:3-323(+)